MEIYQLFRKLKKSVPDGTLTHNMKKNASETT